MRCCMCGVHRWLRAPVPKLGRRRAPPPTEVELEYGRTTITKVGSTLQLPTAWPRLLAVLALARLQWLLPAQVASAGFGGRGSRRCACGICYIPTALSRVFSAGC